MFFLSVGAVALVLFCWILLGVLKIFGCFSDISWGVYLIPIWLLLLFSLVVIFGILVFWGILVLL